MNLHVGLTHIHMHIQRIQIYIIKEHECRLEVFIVNSNGAFINTNPGIKKDSIQSNQL